MSNFYKLNINIIPSLNKFKIMLIIMFKNISCPKSNICFKKISYNSKLLSIKKYQCMYIQCDSDDLKKGIKYLENKLKDVFIFAKT